MNSSHTLNFTKPPPVEQIYTSLNDVFEQALELELMLAQQKLAAGDAGAASAVDSAPRS